MKFLSTIGKNAYNGFHRKIQIPKTVVLSHTVRMPLSLKLITCSNNILMVLEKIEIHYNQYYCVFKRNNVSNNTEIRPDEENILLRYHEDKM